MYGHGDMLDYLSAYRTQDKMFGTHYYPSGALCWFETNQYGDTIGSVYYARKIPDKSLIEDPRRQRGLRNILKRRKKSVKEILTKERPDTEEWEFVKPRFHQQMKQK